MVNIKLAKTIFNELKKDYCSINHLSNMTIYSSNHIWNILRVLDALNCLDIRFSEERKNARLYKLKDNVAKMTFDEFLQKYGCKI